MSNGSDRDPGRQGELGGDYARDTHRDLGDDYARDRGWSGAGGHDDYTRDPRPAEPDETSE